MATERIFFGTNRDPKPPQGDPQEFGHNLSSEGHDDLRFGEAQVDDSGKVVSLKCLPSKPEEGSKALLLQLKTKMREQQRPIFIFIHGYNTNWAAACKAAANLKRAYKHINPDVFLFSWPSDGKFGPLNPGEYRDDRTDAAASGRAIFRGLMKLRDFLADPTTGPACGQKIVLFVHSMGNYVLRNAIQAMIAETPPSQKLTRLFDYIISAAADEDNDAFLTNDKWGRIGELCGEMVVYINKNDTALWGSDVTKGNPERMGNKGPSKPFEIPHNVSVVDVSKLDPLSDIVGHGYFDTWPKVIDDITAVIAGIEAEEVPGRNAIPMKNKYALG